MFSFYFKFKTTRKRSLGQGNIFTSVCDSFCSLGVLRCHFLFWHGQHTPLPPGQQTPLDSTPPVNQYAVRILLECFLAINVLANIWYPVNIAILLPSKQVQLLFKYVANDWITDQSSQWTIRCQKSHELNRQVISGWSNQPANCSHCHSFFVEKLVVASLLSSEKSWIHFWLPMNFVNTWHGVLYQWVFGYMYGWPWMSG